MNEGLIFNAAGDFAREDVTIHRQGASGRNPGGIGALEGGLLAALLLYGLPAAPTAAAVVLYHAIALWVPALGGTYGFARLRRTIAARRPPLVTVAPPPQPAVSDLAA